MNKKTLSINLISNILTFIVNMAMSLFLSPYIVKTIGTDAYGFVGLANNFVNYAQIITIALNSMAGRYITIKVHQNDEKMANVYYTSVIISNIIMSAIIGVISVIVVVYLQYLIKIPANLFFDVKILFLVMFMNFIVSILTTTHSVAVFVKNRLELSAIRDIVSNIIKVGLLVGLFAIFKPNVVFVGIASLGMTVISALFNIVFKKKLLPNLKFKMENFKLWAIKELLASGLWNSITKLSQVLLDGLDLWICNIFISPQMMGILSITKIVPTAIGTLIATLIGIYAPQFTIHYANGDFTELSKAVKDSIRNLGVIVNVPIALFMIFGREFYAMWQPTVDTTLLYNLTLLNMGVYVISGSINTLYNIFTVVNKVKVNSLVMLANGILSTILVFILIKTTNLGVYAIAGVSCVLGILRNLFFTPMYCAKCIKQKIGTFYPYILKSIISVIVIAIPCFIIKAIFPITGWMTLISAMVISLILGLIVNVFVYYKPSEIKGLIIEIKEFFKKKFNKKVSE